MSTVQLSKFNTFFFLKILSSAQYLAVNHKPIEIIHAKPQLCIYLQEILQIREMDVNLPNKKDVMSALFLMPLITLEHFN